MCLALLLILIKVSISISIGGGVDGARLNVSTSPTRRRTSKFGQHLVMLHTPDAFINKLAG